VVLADDVAVLADVPDGDAVLDGDGRVSSLFRTPDSVSYHECLPHGAEA